MFYSRGKNLRDGEVADPFWVKKAGLQALPLVEIARRGRPGRNFSTTWKGCFPQLKDSLEKKRAGLAVGKKLTSRLTPTPGGSRFPWRTTGKAFIQGGDLIGESFKGFERRQSSDPGATGVPRFVLVFTADY